VNANCIRSLLHLLRSAIVTGFGWAVHVKVSLTPAMTGSYGLQQQASEKRQGTKSREVVYGAGRGLLMGRPRRAKSLPGGWLRNGASRRRWHELVTTGTCWHGS